ncbi:hypothetical protein GS429_11660 [Natronorubrum sp. JWXQ-INN-674]|uniref:CARDB domain-containing protein n=1 Tax=Natronorubrum halalkaliphilum TaxID=2691917 RepID=A0A6B0VMK6_9EURY|nr:hypothetical protein [Natronorubrum halalkaliphilum]MXV62708.1 hypothetical protein [Natronorubrum halalkaliphilum]
MTGEHGRERSNLYWVPSLLFVLALLCLVVGLTYVIQDQFYRAGFVVAAIMASIGFHLFSLGNTAYGCAAALENEALTEYAYHINQNGIYATFGAGGVFLGSAMWFLFQEFDAPTEFVWYLALSDLSGLPPGTVERLHFDALRLVMLLGVLTFSIGFLNQSSYGNWFTVVLDEIDASNDYTTVVDQAIDGIAARFRRSEIDDLTEHTISITERNPPEFRVVRVEGPDEIDPGEEYTVRATVENRGDERGHCTVVYQREGDVVNSIEKTIPSAARTTVEFLDTAPQSDDELTVGIGLETTG